MLKGRWSPPKIASYWVGVLASFSFFVCSSVSVADLVDTLDKNEERKEKQPKKATKQTVPFEPKATKSPSFFKKKQKRKWGVGNQRLRSDLSMMMTKGEKKEHGGRTKASKKEPRRGQRNTWEQPAGIPPAGWGEEEAVDQEEDLEEQPARIPPAD